MWKRPAKSACSSRPACCSRTRTRSPARRSPTTCLPASAWAPPASAMAWPSPTAASRHRLPLGGTAPSAPRGRGNRRLKPTVISAEALFEQHREALHWEWVAGHAHPDRRFDDAAIRDAQSAADLVGYLNYIHPYRVQLVGTREVAYLGKDAGDEQERRISRIVTLEPPVIIVADGKTPPDRLVAMCDRADIPLFVTAESAGHVIDVVRAYLSQLFADRTTRHGVFMDILGLGVLLTGESGLGKSELGLELISRGHGLVADDAGDRDRVSQSGLEGRVPEL